MCVMEELFGGVKAELLNEGGRARRVLTYKE
jgi:hypothetical protein